MTLQLPFIYLMVSSQRQMGCLFQTYLSDEIYFSSRVNTETALLCLLQASIKKKKDKKNIDILDHEDSRASKFCSRERGNY